MKVGVLGGTFDPIHAGHIAAARAAIDCARLDEVLLIPTGLPPHRGQTVASPEERLAMCRLAAEGVPAVGVSDIEVRRGGVSYTADTLAELAGERPGDELYLILGWDAARLFATWHTPDVVRRLAHVIVVTRPGIPAPDVEALRSAGLDATAVILCERPTPDISGSALRRAIAAGEDVGDRLAPAVERYIDEHGLYGDNR